MLKKTVNKYRAKARGRVPQMTFDAVTSVFRTLHFGPVKRGLKEHYFYFIYFIIELVHKVQWNKKCNEEYKLCMLRSYRPRFIRQYSNDIIQLNSSKIL